MRKILTRQSYLDELNRNYYKKFTGIETINEAPVYSDVPWGDSLVGRLINSIARKTKIVFNKARISGLVKGLKSIFDEIIEIGKYEVSGDSSEFINFFRVLELLKKLNDQVENEEDLSVLINTTQECIDFVSRTELDKKDVMISALEEFLNYLKELDDKSDSEDSDEIENAEESEDSSFTGSVEDPVVIFYNSSRKLLQSIVDLSKMIKQNVVRVGGGSEDYDNKVISKRSKLKVGSEYLYLNVKGEKFRCKLLSLDYKIERATDKKWLTGDDKKGQKLNNDQACVVYKLKSDDYNDNYKSEVVEILKLYSLDGKEPEKITEKPKENISTFFDKEKFTKLEKSWNSSKNPSQLKELIKMCQSAVKIFTSKKMTAEIKFFTDKLNSFLLTLARQQARSMGISTTVQQKISKSGGGFTYKDTGVQKTIKQLQDDIAKFSKKPYSIETSVKVNASVEILADYETINEVEANLGKSEVFSNNAWKKVVKAFNDSKIDSYTKSIEELLSITVKDGKDQLKQAKKDIKSICKQVILNKSTVGKPVSYDILIKESINVNDISKSISLIARILLAYKEDMTLVGSYGSAISPLKLFITSFDTLEKTLPKLTSESVFRYTNFISINEKNKFPTEIKQKFEEIFTGDVKEMFNIKDKAEFEKRVKERPEGELVISTSDPIIEIVRLFNRAWRIHTPGVIPSGRSNGRVSNSVFREYENLGDRGGTPDDPGSGPYRNIELYEQWFEAVQDILSDSKYRPIFSENTVFLFKNEETGGTGDPIRKPGKILLSFINSLLSDTQMYKGGAMTKFISDYFDLKGEKLPTLALPGSEKDIELNSKTTNEITVTELKFAKIDTIKDFNKYGGDLGKLFYDRTVDTESGQPMREKYKNISFKIKGKIGDTQKTYFFTYKGLGLQYPLFLMSTGNFPFDFTKVGGTDIKKSETAKKVYVSSLPKTDGVVKIGGIMKLRFVDLQEPRRDSLNDDINDSRVDFEVTSIEILVDSNMKLPYLSFESNYTPSKKNIIDLNFSKSNVAKTLVMEK